MASNQSAKEEIKRTADIVELIGQFVQLKKAGRNYVGLCPFHAEKAPSFTVSPERQTFHCFGCKKGGDIFSFWMEYHSSTFPEALRDLAERYHVTISEGFSGAEERKKAAQRDTLRRINEITAEYFEEALKHKIQGGAAGNYLNKRSISKEIISEFRLGFAPDKWDGLVSALRQNKLDLDMAVQAGVVVPRKSGGYYDRFRGRLMFPISDLRKNIVAFGGRVLDDSLPKYLNTPETPIFHKSESLYGLNTSLEAIRKKQRAVIVEGYMDLLALRKHGLEEVVATLGTALTAMHVRKLKGYTKEVLVVFDSDEAGRAAVLKSLPVFSNEGLSAKAVVLPDGHDPDSFVNKNGLANFLELLDRALPMFDFYLEQKLTPNVQDVEGKVRVIEEIIPLLSGFRSDTQRSLYIHRVSERIGIKEEVIFSELARHGNSSRNASKRNMNERLNPQKAKRNQNDIQQLDLLVHHPHAAERLIAGDCKILLSDPTVIEIVDAVFEKFRNQGQCSTEDLSESLHSEDARIQLREMLSRGSDYSDEGVEQALAEIEGKAYQKKLLASFKKAKEQGNKERMVQLTKLRARAKIT
ncbi:MAG: DNA primase [Desulfobacterales bacterium]|nr:DNA primase [Desulfobacterales bacterium]